MVNEEKWSYFSDDMENSNSKNLNGTIDLMHSYKSDRLGPNQFRIFLSPHCRTKIRQVRTKPDHLSIQRIELVE